MTLTEALRVAEIADWAEWPLPVLSLLKRKFPEFLWVWTIDAGFLVTLPFGAHDTEDHDNQN